MTHERKQKQQPRNDQIKKIYVNEPLQLRIIPLNAVTHKPVHFYEHEYRHCQPTHRAKKCQSKIKLKNEDTQTGCEL